jgi:VanZ family protein
MNLRRFVLVIFCVYTAAVLWLTLEPTPGGGRAHELPKPVSLWVNNHDSSANILAFFLLAIMAFWLGHEPAGSPGLPPLSGGREARGEGQPERTARYLPRMPSRRQRLIFLLLLAFVALIEFAQIWIPGRVSELHDVASGWEGIVFAALFNCVLAPLRGR